jgi:predicted transcriptional regulator
VLGYLDVEDLLRAKADVPNRALSVLLGVTCEQTRKLRARFGFASPGRWEGHVPTSPAHRPRLDPTRLAAIPAGEQPTRGEESLCLECGGWFRTRGMPQHLTSAHALTVGAYRSAHGIDPIAERARDLGHAGVEDLVAATMHLDAAAFAELVGLNRREAGQVRRRYSPRPATPEISCDDLAQLPAGLQPESDGKLLCRECGRWFRGLAQHLPHKHGVTPDEYRERHGLAVGACLQSADLHEKRSEYGRVRWERETEWRERFLAQGYSLRDPEQREMAMAGRRESATRPGGRAHLLESGDRLARVLPQRTREDFERRAHELGYSSVEEMLRATAHLSGAALGRLLGVASHRVYSLRLRHGFERGGRVRTPAAASAAVPVPDVTLPGDERMVCLECGGSYAFVGKHVAAAHGLRPTEYRARHGLAPDQPLHPFSTGPSES